MVHRTGGDERSLSSFVKRLIPTWLVPRTPKGGKESWRTDDERSRSSLDESGVEERWRTGVVESWRTGVVERYRGDVERSRSSSLAVAHTQ